MSTKTCLRQNRYKPFLIRIMFDRCDFSTKFQVHRIAQLAADLIILYSCSGYMAPEYAMRGYLTDKADVYTFRVVALEIVSGKSNTNYRPKEDFVYLLDWVTPIS
jgi:hypothetical protein